MKKLLTIILAGLLLPVFVLGISVDKNTYFAGEDILITEVATSTNYVQMFREGEEYSIGDWFPLEPLPISIIEVWEMTPEDMEEYFYPETYYFIEMTEECSPEEYSICKASPNFVAETSFLIIEAGPEYTPLFELPETSVDSTTGFITDLFDAIGPFIWLFLGIPLGFVVVKRIIKVVPK